MRSRETEIHRGVLTLNFLRTNEEYRRFAAQFSMLERDLTSQFLSARAEDVSDGTRDLANKIGGSCINVNDLERERLDLFEVEIKLKGRKEKEARG